MSIEIDLKKCKRNTTKQIEKLVCKMNVYFFMGMLLMQQLKLFNESGSFLKTICVENVRAVFYEISEDCYEIMLDINSNKFLININIVMDKIERLEIVAVKGFVEVSMRIVRIIRRIVYKLYFEV